MILLDTHIWVWWVQGDPRLSESYRLALDSHESIAISAISCWEVGKLAQRRRLVLPVPTATWLKIASAGIKVIGLTPEIVADATQLPDEFKSDPADEIIVATARVLGCKLATQDSKIVAYPHVKLFKPPKRA